MPADAIALRHELRPGDVEAVAGLHGMVYAAEYGFDATFAEYVRGPLEAFARGPGRRERIWLAERDGRLAGCVAIVRASDSEAQLRWFLVAPPARGLGLGRRLLAEAVEFSRRQGYASVFLWTVDLLTAAARLYRAAGFTKVEGNPGRRWGVDVVEEKYVLPLEAAPPEQTG